jgi:uncharacterized DUF497 family protein
MIDFGRIEGFDWDSGNLSKSTDKHDVTPAEAEQVFFNEPLLVIQEEKHSGTEPRFHALGTTNESRLLHIAFTLRDDRRKIRVISERKMHRKERMVYEAQTR